jgi:uncharacterized protein (DUF169 family)
MTTLKEFNRCGEELEQLLILRTSPLAVKMLERESDIPQGAIRPFRDRGIHLAQCQAFALSRRQKETIAMLKEDNWCFAALIAYGLVDKPQDPELQRFLGFPTFPRDKYVGIVSAPLRTANFAPDVVIIYSNTAQLRNMLLPFHFGGEEDLVGYHFFPPACAYQLIPVMNSGKLMVTLPDPGDYHRALATEDEIVLSVPPARLTKMLEGIREIEKGDFAYSRAGMYMLPDFPQPEFYQMLFKRWGLYDYDKGKK